MIFLSGQGPGPRKWINVNIKKINILLVVKKIDFFSGQGPGPRKWININIKKNQYIDCCEKKLIFFRDKVQVPENGSILI